MRGPVFELGRNSESWGGGLSAQKAVMKGTLVEFMVGGPFGMAVCSLRKILLLKGSCGANYSSVARVWSLTAVKPSVKCN